MNLTENGKLTSAFDGQTSILHTGKDFGVVHPSAPNFADQFGRIQKLTGQNRILAQKLGFNTRVTPIRAESDMADQGSPEGFFRTPDVTDGVVVSITGDTAQKIAVMIMNADCGVVQILAPNGELAVLHGGFDNIDNKDGSSIVMNAINYFKSKGINPAELRFRIGEAAQACCYGLNDPKYAESNLNRANKMVNAYGVLATSPVINLPRSANNGIGFNVAYIAAKQAEIAGITDIDLEKLCTSCYGLDPAAMPVSDSYGAWFSNLRENPSTTKANGFGARNAVVVY